MSLSSSGPREDHALAEEQIVDNSDRVGLACYEEKSAALGSIVDDGVVDHVQLIDWIRQALGSIRDDRRVFGVGSLLDEMPDDVRDPPIREVDVVTRGSARLVHDAVVEDVVGPGAALYVVADPRMMEIAPAEGKALHPPDVDVVGLTIAVAVRGEFRVFNDHVAIAPSTEDAVLVVVKVTVAHRQSDTVLADTSTILVGHPGSREHDILDRRVPSLDHPDPFALGMCPVRLEMRTSSDTSDGETVRHPDGHVPLVDSGVDFDDVAVSGDPCS